MQKHHSREIALPLAKTNCMPDFTDEEREWIAAVERYRNERNIRYPTAVDLLRLAHAIGYRKVQPADETKLKLAPLADKRISGKGKKLKVNKAFARNICNRKSKERKGNDNQNR